MKTDRRTFLKDAALLTAGLGLSPLLKPSIAAGLEEMATGRAPLLWLQGQSCSGCSVSLLNSESPDPATLLTRYISLYFHQTISAATGESAHNAVETAIKTGGFILVIEGAVPVGMPESCVISEEPFIELVSRAARQAKAVVAAGTCAAFGGIPAAPPNLTGAMSVSEALQKRGIATPVINLPGCPNHPAWLIGNLVYVLKVGIPELDEHLRPKRTYGETVHDRCSYFHQYQAKQFASALGEEGCLFKLGCQGVITNADCGVRQWNGGMNWCVRAHAPCVGCAHPQFVRNPEFTLFRLNEQEQH